MTNCCLQPLEAHSTPWGLLDTDTYLLCRDSSLNDGGLIPSEAAESSDYYCGLWSRKCALGSWSLDLTSCQLCCNFEQDLHTVLALVSSPEVL